LRLQKLKENQANLSEDDYQAQVEELHQTLMGLGEWWVGIEDQVFEPQKFSDD